LECRRDPSIGWEEWNAHASAKQSPRASRLAPRASRLSVYLAIATLIAILGVAVNISPAHAAPAMKCKLAANVLSGGGACPQRPIILSAKEQAILARKQALATEYAAVRAGKLSASQYQRDLQAFMAKYGGNTHPNTASVNNIPAQFSIQPLCVVDPSTGQCATGYKSVSLTQQAQTTTYYCGPATASEILGVRGVSKSQSFLAGSSYLKTDQNGGTNFGDMAPTLNTLTNSSFYSSVEGSTLNGTGFNTSTWENDMVTDINQGWAPAGNIVEVSSDNVRLVGHPSNLTPYGGAIYHWIAIYGYDNNGGDTWYADSIGGTTFWAFSANVPRYSSYSSSNMTILLNRRGFVW
jgi:hypothetical protein